MVGVSLKDKNRNELIRQRTKLTDITLKVGRMKWQRASYICRRTGNRWSKHVLERRPRLGERSVGSPLTRCPDDLSKRAGIDWMQKQQTGLCGVSWERPMSNNADADRRRWCESIFWRLYVNIINALLFFSILISF